MVEILYSSARNNTDNIYIYNITPFSIHSETQYKSLEVYYRYGIRKELLSIASKPENSATESIVYVILSGYDLNTCTATQRYDNSSNSVQIFHCQLYNTASTIITTVVITTVVVG